MCNRAITVSSFLFVQGQTTHSFKTWNIIYNLFPETVTILIYIYLHVILSLRMGWAQLKLLNSTAKDALVGDTSVANKGIFSCWVCSRISPWPETQIKTVSSPSLVKSIYSSRICTKTGCSYFKLNIAFCDESVKNDFSLEQ